MADSLNSFRKSVTNDFGGHIDTSNAGQREKKKITSQDIAKRRIRRKRQIVLKQGAPSFTEEFEQKNIPYVHEGQSAGAADEVNPQVFIKRGTVAYAEGNAGNEDELMRSHPKVGFNVHGNACDRETISGGFHRTCVPLRWDRLHMGLTEEQAMQLGVTANGPSADERVKMRFCEAVYEDDLDDACSTKELSRCAFPPITKRADKTQSEHHTHYAYFAKLLPGLNQASRFQQHRRMMQDRLVLDVKLHLPAIIK